MCQSESNRSGLRIPFGLRDQRIWAPLEVENGDSCGCVCPACEAPVTARHGRGVRQPHFSHKAAGDCSGNFETAAHSYAKHLIELHSRILLPEWIGGPSFPNPPVAHTAEGKLLKGGKVAWPARITDLRDVRPELSAGEFRPDITSRDEQGELLIEIRVSHAVDDTKAAAVRRGGYRMIEIDLSRMAGAMWYDMERFKNEVLFSETNRTWISHPAAEAAWRSARDRVMALAAEASAENTVLSADVPRKAEDRILGTPTPTIFRLEEIKPLPRSEADDPKLYWRIGTRTHQPGLGDGLVLSRATRARAIYRVQFDFGVRHILFQEDEPEFRF
jgi:Competence protein CoiA-like family